jgi:hypothetical protein
VRWPSCVERTRSSRPRQRFCSGGTRPPTQVVVDYIGAHKDRFGVEPICRTLIEHGVKIAPSTYYQRVACPVSAAELADAYAADTLVDLYRLHRRLYGVRKLWHTARRAGHDWGRDQVGRLMGLAGIDGVRRGRRTTTTTRRDSAASRHPDLIDRGLRHADPARPVAVCRLHLRVDVSPVRLRQFRHRRLLPPDPRLAGVHVEDDAAGDLGAGAGPVHPPPRQRRLHRHRPGASLRCRVAVQSQYSRSTRP